MPEPHTPSPAPAGGSPLAAVLRHAVPQALAAGQAVALAVLPQGLQQGSRRNAWAAMAADATRARARQEAAVALETADGGRALDLQVAQR